MRILLPPSEGKRPPKQGQPYQLDELSSPALNGPRAHVLRTLVDISVRPDALATLKVGASLHDQVAANRHLYQAPAQSAFEVYTGVLYSAAALHEVSADRLQAEVRILSGLWGVLNPTDRIPAYRLSMGVSLPGIGPLGTWWRGHLTPVLNADSAGHLLVDCRSSAYVSAWRPPNDATQVTVSVLREHDGHRSVVSHHAKHLRGVLAGHLLRHAGGPFNDVESLVTAAIELVGTETGGPVNDTVIAVELRDAPRGGHVLDLVTRTTAKR